MDWHELPPAPVPFRAKWGRRSLIFAAASVLAPLALLLFFAGILYALRLLDQAPVGWEALGDAIITFLAATGVGALVAAGGVTAGVMSLVRRERPRWYAVAGLVVCVPILLGAAGLLLSELLS